jgi:acetyltransferase-like isoleucine patch superfamily enzyme
MSYRFFYYLKKFAPFNLTKSLISRLERVLCKRYIHHTAIIHGAGSIHIGDCVHIDEGTVIYLPEGSCLNLEKNCRIASNCYIEPGIQSGIRFCENSSVQARSYVFGDVHIGKSTLLAPNCFISSTAHIFSGDEDLTIKERDHAYIAKHGSLKSKNIIIGDDCWLGINVVLLPGVRIGTKTVIAANTVLKGSFPARSVVKQGFDYSIEEIRYLQ